MREDAIVQVPVVHSNFKRHATPGKFVLPDVTMPVTMQTIFNMCERRVNENVNLGEIR